MNDTIEQLEFKYKLNKALRRKKTFDKALEDDFLLENLSSFLHTKIGKIWLKSDIGKQYTLWQSQ